MSPHLLLEVDQETIETITLVARRLWPTCALTIAHDGAEALHCVECDVFDLAPTGSPA
jgi:hypothetical protein